MRAIDDHKVRPDETLEIYATDEPGIGGACHEYVIHCIEGQVLRSFVIDFQCGTIPEVGVNGVTHEALLAIVIDRLRHFQAGKYACRENAIALTHCEDALHWLQHRTRSRMRRGVEGKHER